MHHEEQDPRHSRHRDQHHRREHHRYPHEEHFNDFRSRWGEPSPFIHLNHQGDWGPEDVGRFEDPGRYHHHREEWLPNQQRRHRQQSHHEHQQRHSERHEHREPIWRQRDVHFDKSNQRVEDRWYEDPLMPHPHQQRHTRPDFWDEDWGERSH